MARKYVSIVFLFLFTNYVLSEFNLTIIHITDFHSNWFEFDEKKGECSKDESREGKCFGGFPRLLTFVREIRKREKNVLVLSSGEFFLGRSLHPLHGWKLAQALLPRLELDAMSLSNHDFDSGMFQLSALLYAMKFPVLCCNMWARNTSFIYSRVNESVVIEVGGQKIGIVGYIHRHALNKTQKFVSIKFFPEIPALQRAVRRLENEGVDKIIALGHAGYYTDLEIAKEVKGVDIVMGGDSDIMLFDPGKDADESLLVGNIHGNYPRIHQHDPEDNDTSLANRTLVLHIPQHGKYVGVLRATFDDRGKIVHESGEPLLLNGSIPQDKETLEFMEYAMGVLQELSEHSRLPSNEEILAKTLKELDGEPCSCRMRECTLGNLVADAFLHEFTLHYRKKSEPRYPNEMWGPIDAVVFNSGCFLHSIEAGDITLQDILRSVSLGAFIERVYMSGKQLTDMMEHAVKHYDPRGITPPGAFLQVAGLRVEYDLSQTPAKRVRSLQIRCRDCWDNETFAAVKPFKTYVIGMPSFLRIGGDGFNQFEAWNTEDFGQFDALLIVEYLRRTFLIEPRHDGRIKFYDSKFKESPVRNSSSSVTSNDAETTTKDKGSGEFNASSVRDGTEEYIRISPSDNGEMTLLSFPGRSPEYEATTTPSVQKYITETENKIVLDAAKTIPEDAYNLRNGHSEIQRVDRTEKQDELSNDAQQNFDGVTDSANLLVDNEKNKNLINSSTTNKTLNGIEEQFRSVSEKTSKDIFGSSNSTDASYNDSGIRDNGVTNTEGQFFTPSQGTQNGISQSSRNYSNADLNVHQNQIDERKHLYTSHQYPKQILQSSSKRTDLSSAQRVNRTEEHDELPMDKQHKSDLSTQDNRMNEERFSTSPRETQKEISVSPENVDRSNEDSRIINEHAHFTSREDLKQTSGPKTMTVSRNDPSNDEGQTALRSHKTRQKLSEYSISSYDISNPPSQDNRVKKRSMSRVRESTNYTAPTEYFTLLQENSFLNSVKNFVHAINGIFSSILQNIFVGNVSETSGNVMSVGTSDEESKYEDLQQLLEQTGGNISMATKPDLLEQLVNGVHFSEKGAFFWTKDSNRSFQEIFPRKLQFP